MGLSDWRAKRHMKDPVRGVFRVTGFYEKYPHSSPPGLRMTGVITAPGIPATVAEHKVDERGKWASTEELPVLVDRSDPARFAILWDEATKIPWRDQERSLAQAEADRLNSGARTGQPGPGAPQQAVLGAPGRPVPGAPGGGVTPQQAAQLLARGGGGEEAEAVVIAAHEIEVPPGMPAPAGAPPPGGVVDLTLEIMRRDGSGYTAVTRVGFSTPERRQRVATVGTELKVLVDPADLGRVVIDTKGLF